MATSPVRCTRCAEAQPSENFRPSELKKNSPWCRACLNARRQELRQAEPKPKHCLQCGADIAHMQAHAKFCSKPCSNKHWMANNPDVHSWHRIKYKYGLTRDQVEAVLEAQGGCCAICGTDRPGGWGWNIDHCHATRVLRGILCWNCNTALGKMEDDANRLRSAADYLDQARKVTDPVKLKLAPSVVARHRSQRDELLVSG